MQNVNITNFRKNIYKMMESAIKYNEPINICTKNGNAVLISEEDYNGLMETLYIESIPGLKEEILEAANAPEEDFVDYNEVEW